MMNLCRFLMVKIPIGSLKAFDVLWNLVINLSIAWDSTQGRASKGLSFWNLQRISFLGRFVCKTALGMATLARLQNASRNGYPKCFFQSGGELKLFICLQHLIGTAMTQASCHRGSCQSSMDWDEGLSLWTLALPQLGPPGDSSQHDPKRFPTSSWEDRGFPLKLDQFYMMFQNAIRTYNFVILIFGWDF